MYCEIGSQASTYCSEVEENENRIEQCNAYTTIDGFPLRRSQRLREKCVTKEPHTDVRETSAENCTEPTINVDLASSPSSILFHYNRYAKNSQSENLFESERQADLLPPAQLNSVVDIFPAVPVKKPRNTKPDKRPPKKSVYKRKTTPSKQVRGRRRKCIKEVKKASRKNLTKNVKTTSRTQKLAIPAKCCALSTTYLKHNFLAENKSSVELQGAPIERYNVMPNIHQTQAVPLAQSVLPNYYPPHFKDQLPPPNGVTGTENAQPHNNRNISEAVVAQFQAEYQRVFCGLQQEQQQEQQFSRYSGLCSEIDTVAMPLPNECHTSSLNNEALLQLSDELDTCSPSVTHDQSTTPSLSDSLHSVFGTNNLRDVLKIGPIRYKLTEEQLTAAAYILNIEVPRLRGVIKMVQRLPADEIIGVAADFSAARLQNLKTENSENDECDSAFSMHLIESSQSPEQSGRRRHFPRQSN